jgi:hypothetical protein
MALKNEKSCFFTLMLKASNAMTIFFLFNLETKEGREHVGTH